MLRFLAVILMLQAFSARADDVDIFRQMMEAVGAQEWEEAANFADAARDDIVEQVFLWNNLRAGNGAFVEYEKFLEENAEWPGLPLLQAKGEGLLYEGLEPARVIGFVEHNSPQTSYGLLRYLEALAQTGKEQDARDEALRAAQSMVIKPEDMKAMAGLGFANMDEIVGAQVSYLLYERKYELARSYMDQLGTETQKTTLMRLGVLSRENPEPETSDGGVLYDRMRIARNDDEMTKAIALALEASTSREALGSVEYWANDRLDLARYALWRDEAETAYELASQHFLEDDEKDYGELEFLAGFIALEFLGDDKAARAHFRNLKRVANTPISNGRAGYWLGRAGDPTGYGYGAKWQTSFYGQLSAQKLGGKFDESLIAARPEIDFAAQGFMKSDNIRAAKYYYDIGNVLLARRFMAHEAETLAPDEAEALGLYAFELDMPDAAVNIGKNLANRGEVIVHSYYPMPEFVPPKPKVPPALLLGIMRQESEFYPKAVSHVGANGLMQLMPGTAKDMAEFLQIEYRQEDLLEEPRYNVQLGSAYIAEMLYLFEGKLPLAVLSYNAGPGRGKNWQENLGPLEGSADEVVHWIEMIPFDETRNYVQRVLEAVFLYQAKLDGKFGAYAPTDLLTRSYPKGVDYQAMREARKREAERKAREAEEAEAEVE